MQNLNCLIVEDEPLAAGVISDYINEIPGLKVSGICGDVFTAAVKLRNEKTDILFLDINLPKMNGMDFIKSLTRSYEIILTTAYHEYAVEGYDLNVTDYLVKPIEFSRFLQAVNKVFGRKKSRNNGMGSARPFLFFSVDKKKVKVFTDEILYIESMKDYVKIQLARNSIHTKYNISDLPAILSDDFIRVHKSYIVNNQHVSAFNATDIEIGKQVIPIGRTFKEEVSRRLEQ